MFRKVFLRILAIPIALFGSKIQAWLSGDPKVNIFTGRQLIITSVFLLGLFVLAAWLETSQTLVWNWPWHRFWFFRDIINQSQWRTHQIFQGLNQVEDAPLAEVLENVKRRNLLALLLDRMARLNPIPRIFITGEGGSGKTTTMEQLRLRLAQTGSKRLGIGKPIPVLVRMGSVSSGKLLDNIRESMDKGSSSSKVLGKGLDDLLRKGRIALLIDSIDESLGQNPNAFREVLDLIESDDYKLAPLIVSGRREEYERQLPAFVEPLKIEELSDEAVLYICNGHANKREGRSADEIFSTLSRNGLLDSGGLARNPFWLKLILQGGTFENNKPKIFDDAINSVLQREWDKAGKKSRWRRHFDAAEQLMETRAALANLAEEVSTRNQGETIDGPAALSVFDKYISGRTGVTGVLRPQDVLLLGLDAQLLYFPPLRSDSDWPPIRFSHRLIREYLTANLLSKPPARLKQALTDHAADMEWWEILLMASTISGLTGRDRKDLLNIVVGDAKDVKRVFLAAAMLGHPHFLFEPLTEPPISSLIESLRHGVTSVHIDAAKRIADIAPDRLVGLLEKLTEAKETGISENINELLTKLLENEIAKVSTSRLVAGLLGSVELREAAVSALVSIGNPAAPHVLPVLRDSHVIARWSAAKVLGEIRERSAVTPLLDLLYDQNSTVRNSAIEALGKIGDPIVIPHFARLLNSDLELEGNVFISSQVSKALGNMGEPAIEYLANMLQNDEPFLSIFAADALKQIGKPAIPAVIRVLKKIDILAVQRVASWFAEVQAVEAIEPLLAWGKTNPIVMQSIRGALPKFGDAAVAPLISFIHDSDPFGQSRAMEMLAEIGGERAIETLTSVLSTRNTKRGSEAERVETFNRASAAAALGRIKDDRVIEALRSAATDERWLIRIKASSALTKLGQDEGLDGVIEGLGADDPRVIGLAIRELQLLKQTRSLINLERFIRTVTKSSRENAPLSSEMQKNVNDAIRAVETITAEVGGLAAEKKDQTEDVEATLKERDFSGYSALLKHPEESVRMDAIKALEEAESPPFDLIRMAVEDSSGTVRVRAVTLAGETRLIEARELLVDLLQHGTHDGVRMTAAEALANFDDDNVRELLTKTLLDESPLVEIGAAAGLAKLGDTSMLPRIADIVDKHDVLLLKVIAVGVYASLEDPAAIPYLEHLIEQYQTTAVTTEDQDNLQNFRVVLDHLKHLST